MSKIQKFVQSVWTIDVDIATRHTVRLQEKDGSYAMQIEQYHDGSHSEMNMSPSEARDLMNAIRCALHKYDRLC